MISNIYKQSNKVSQFSLEKQKEIMLGSLEDIDINEQEFAFTKDSYASTKLLAI